MGLIRTDQWLLDYQKEWTNKDVLKYQCQKLCKPLTTYFKDTNDIEIHQHLLESGMFPPYKNYEKIIQSLIENNVWKKAHKEYQSLKKEWDGPSVAIFIFPANHQNRQLKNEFNGKTGLSYQDKLFLFISEDTSDSEMKALLTHEYHHACRLKTLKTDNLSLIETLILEGMAEKAVEERLGKGFLAPWTSFYSKEKALYHWKRYLSKFKHVKRTHPIHSEILYGIKGFPKWGGYNAGFHIVDSYIQKREYKTRDLIDMAAEDIIEETDFK